MRLWLVVWAVAGWTSAVLGGLGQDEETRRVLDELATEEDVTEAAVARVNIQRLGVPRAGAAASRTGAAGAAAAAGGSSGPGWLSSLYDPYSWQARRPPAAHALSPDCRSSLKLYLNALANGTAWAAQMTDASGRYSSQFFFGNDFWLGSRHLCEMLDSPGWPVHPPFSLRYHVANLMISLPKRLMPQKRLISLGVCLPSACTSREVAALVGSSSANAPAEHAMQVLKVRPVPGPYSLWADPKLHILGSVTLIVIIIMVTGTLYEYRFEKKIRNLRQNNNESGGNLYSLEKIIYDNSITKSDSSLDDSVDPCQGLGIIRRVLLSFSVLTNGRKILHCGAAPKDSLTCLHGLRFFSLTWVILVHTVLQIIIIADNKAKKAIAEQGFMYQTIFNATFSVDTFFFISGLLVTYLYLKNGSQREGETTVRSPRTPKPLSVEARTMSEKFTKLVLYRFFRLTPAYLFVLVCAELSMKYLKNVTIFEPISMDDVNCGTFWWRNILYINSLFPRKDICMLWSWYMANDTQFYVLGVFFLLLSTRYFKVAVTGLCLILISSSITTALISVNYQYLVRVDDPFMFFDELYDKPWTRIGPNLLGMFTGWFLHKTRLNFRPSKMTVLIGWFFSLSTICGLIYGVRDSRLGVPGSAMYVSLGHIAWGCALSWIVIACCTGHGGFIDSLLSNRLIYPLSRLTYCAYLIHPVIMTLTGFQMKGPFHVHEYIGIVLFLGNIVAAFIASFFISLAFEAPVVRLLKIIMPPTTSRTQYSASAD